MSEKGKAEREVLVPVWDKPEPYFEYTEMQKKRIAYIKNNPWRVISDNKRRAAHRQASTCESLLNVYPEGIEIGSVAGAGEVFALGIFGIFIGFSASIALLLFEFSTFLGRMEKIDYIFAPVLLFVSIIFFLFGVMCLKMAFFMPRDFPTLFNRKTRQVSFRQVVPIPFWKFWRKGGAGPVQTVPWEATKVRSYKFIEAPGGRVFRDMYLLRLLWEDPAHPRKLKSWMNIGYKGWWEDERLFRLWEHIRRYMEEDGPPIQPGEALRTTGHGKLPKFPAEVIAAAGGPALSTEAVTALAGSAPRSAKAEARKT